MKNFNGFSLTIALAVGDVSGYCVLSNHCHIQILDVTHDLLCGFVSGLLFSSLINSVVAESRVAAVYSEGFLDLSLAKIPFSCQDPCVI